MGRCSRSRVPSVILIPAKLLGVYLLATGHFVTAGVIIVAAKFASTALIARIFLLTKPALMQIPWFAYAYGVFVPWQEALFARIRASWPWRYGRILKWRVKNYVRTVLALAASAHRSAVARTEAEAAGAGPQSARRTCRTSMRASPRRAGASRANCRRPTRILRRR